MLIPFAFVSTLTILVTTALLADRRLDLLIFATLIAGLWYGVFLSWLADWWTTKDSAPNTSQTRSTSRVE